VDRRARFFFWLGSDPGHRERAWKGLQAETMPGLNSVFIVFSQLEIFTVLRKFSGQQNQRQGTACRETEIETVSFITIFLMRISSVSPGSAPVSRWGR